jgi:hypothetical protein
MSRYGFLLEKYEIKDTRSRHKDTNYITAALSVNGVQKDIPQTKFMGDQDNGIFQVGFNWPDVEVPEGGTVTLLYQIMNSGHKDHVAMESALNAVVERQLASESPVDWKVQLVKALANHTVKLVFANCDGPIAPPEGRKVVWSSQDLKAVHPGVPFHETQNEPGNDSPSGCGRNSHYIVHHTVTAL